MTFSKKLGPHTWNSTADQIYSAAESDIDRVLASSEPDISHVPVLLSPAADKHLELMAKKAHTVTRQRFGNIVQLYAPLYLSNECTNSCLYCGFNAANTITRKTLTAKEIKAEAGILKKLGFAHILLLTGEDKVAVPVEQLITIAETLHPEFASLSIEVYPMELDEYEKLARAGIDGLTLYQETYNNQVYDHVHPRGKKRDYTWRLDGPDRGARAGFRRVGIGTLMGLADWRVDTAITIMHGWHLMKQYWKTQVQVSFPRITAAPGGFTAPVPVTDRDLAHAITAARLVLHDAALALSTREKPALRDNLLNLGITTMSAGSRTEPGGYGAGGTATSQFAIEDPRTPDEIYRAVKKQGLEAVWKDWDSAFI